VSPSSGSGEPSRAAARPVPAADPRITDIQREFGASRSRRQRYADLVIGQTGLWPLVRYELTMLCSAWVPGALGLFLRSKLYPLLLGHVGRNVAFGANIVLRHPHKISIDDNVVIDDNCCLDAKGTTNRGIDLKRGVFLGRNTILSCKNGNIVLDEDANIGFNVEVFSAADVRIGRKVLVAAYTYLVGGDHLYDRVDIAVLDQGRTARGIDVGDNVWLGAHVVVADGVRIGRDAVIGAGAVVTSDVPEFHVAAGVPARVIRDRRAPAGPDRRAEAGS
jgi:acetyltransferase-like isoleucine patch superfamily enzyme